MPEGPGDGQERTEAPTPRRLQRAREEGQVAVSHEVPVLAVLAAATLALAWAGPPAGRALLHTGRALMQHAAANEASPAGVAIVATEAGGLLAAPLLLIAAAGAAVHLLQTGGLFSPSLLRPDPSRINPIAGIGRLFSLDAVGEGGGSLLKLGLIGLVLWRMLPDGMTGLPGWPFPHPGLLAADLVAAAVRLLGAILLAQAVVAVLDLLWVRFRFTARMRMSREEIREEQKETEGDPHTKMRLRRLRMGRARRRMLAAVPKAAVVITNPTHYAVALAYDRTKPAAPRVVAKGVDSMAERIRDIARENGVPLVPSPPLARALHRLDLDQEIPAEHYKAVAEIIAYVWRLRERVRAA